MLQDEKKEAKSLQINIYKDKMLGARLFGAPVLFSAHPIPRKDIPQGWFCCDLRGTAGHPDEPHALVDMTAECSWKRLANSEKRIRRRAGADADRMRWIAGLAKTASGTAPKTFFSRPGQAVGFGISPNCACAR
ncbi:LPD28 domain-containing protein [Oscillospiraceae bacterium 38-13]